MGRRGAIEKRLFCVIWCDILADSGTWREVDELHDESADSNLCLLNEECLCLQQ